MAIQRRPFSRLLRHAGDTEDVFSTYVTVHLLHDILDDDHMQWHPQLIGHYTNFWPLLIWTLLSNLTFYLIVLGFHRTYATGAACQQRTLTPPAGHLVLSHFGTCMCSNVETNLSWTCLVSGLLNFEHPSVLLLCSVPGLSDHDVVLVGSNIIPQRRKPVRRLIYIWSKADIPAMEKEMNEFASEFGNKHLPSTPVNTMWMDIKGKWNKVITTHVPSKYTSTQFSQPWCNRDTRRRSRWKKRAHIRARRTQRTSDWDHFRKLQVKKPEGLQEWVDYLC